MEINRKLATIRKVDKLVPIFGADRIEICMIGGWSVIVKKGELAEGGKCVFFEIDSFLPDEEKYEFLGKPKTHQGKLGHRLRTMKMRGVTSSGLALPLETFSFNEQLSMIGTDVTEQLNVFKFDIDLVQGGAKTPGLTGDAKGKFPSFIPKTDEERIQNLPHYFDIHKDTIFEETLKLDGSSCTMYKTKIDLPKWKRWLNKVYPFFKTTYFGVCSRNIELSKPGPNDKQSNFWNMAIKYQIEKDLPIGYAIQGEVIAPNIQSNYEKVKEAEFYIFNVFDIAAQKPLPPQEARRFVYLRMINAHYIPVVSTSRIFQECQTFEEIQARVSGPSINPDVKSEGRVYQSEDGSISFKCVSNEYLLQKGK